MDGSYLELGNGQDGTAMAPPRKRTVRFVAPVPVDEKENNLDDDEMMYYKNGDDESELFHQRPRSGTPYPHKKRKDESGNHPYNGVGTMLVPPIYHRTTDSTEPPFGGIPPDQSYKMKIYNVGDDDDDDDEDFFDADDGIGLAEKQSVRFFFVVVWCRDHGVTL